jgi:murein DD-endopeptidase MepM/ murein hydrolase activator NlpD
MRTSRSGWLVFAVATAACSPVYLARAPGDVSVDAAGSARGVAEGRGVDAPPPAAAPAVRSSEGSSELAGILATLVWPLAADRTRLLSSPYGVREHPADGALRFHAGLDLRSPEGTPVYAAAEGRVTRSGDGGAYGNMVVVDHGAGLSSLYGHHRENLVREGELVRRGQVIALVGHSGNATGDHLHFELRWRGGTVDPRVVLPRLGTAPAR